MRRDLVKAWCKHSWREGRRELLLLLCAIAVSVAMVLVAERARENSEHHLRAQALAERVRASGQQLSAVAAQAMADVWAGPNPRRGVDPQVVARGFAAWNDLGAALVALRKLDPQAVTPIVRADVSALFSVGMQTLQIASRPRAAIQLAETRFRPAVDRLNNDLSTVARHALAASTAASRRASAAFVASLMIGLLALILLTYRMQRLRRDHELEAERRAIESRSEQRIRALLEHSTDVSTLLDSELNVRWQAASVRRMLGYEPERLTGLPVTTIVDPREREVVQQFLAGSLEHRGPRGLEARLQHADGSLRHVEMVVDNRLRDPAVQGVVLSMRDVTERKELEDELRHRAFHDALTGLANRALFEDRLSHALAGAERDNDSFAVLFVDLDDFKMINDEFGHSGGDQLLRTVARRLIEVLRPTDTAARLGGDEFAVLMAFHEDKEEARVVARRVLEALSQPLVIADQEVRVSASVGIAFSSEGWDAETLLRCADVAMYAAKQAGRSEMRTFDPAMQQLVVSNPLP